MRIFVPPRRDKNPHFLIPLPVYCYAKKYKEWLGEMNSALKNIHFCVIWTDS